MLISLPGFDKITQVNENGFSEGMNRVSINQNIVFDSKKITQEILTSQESGNYKNVINSMIKAFSEDPYCAGCGEIADIEIIRGEFPIEIASSDSKNLKSEYILAIIPSKRGDSSENIVISVSFPWENYNELGNTAGLIIPLSKYIANIHWLSKDFMILFTDSNIPLSTGIHSFLRDLSTSPKLFKYNGRIRTALCLEIFSSTPKKIIIDIESIDGILPNQDFPNAVIREIESHFNYPPISINTRIFWDSIARQAMNKGSNRPHTPFLLQKIPSFTITFKDELPQDPRVTSASNFKNYEFISLSSIQQAEILKILEGVIKIQSNLHDELHRSNNRYYYTSYFSVLNFGIYLIPLILILFPSFINIITQLSNDNGLLIAGTAFSTLFYSTVISILNFTSQMFEINYFSNNRFENLNLLMGHRNWILFAFFVVVLIALTTILFKVLICLLNSQKTGSRVEILTSIGIAKEIFIIIYSIFLSITNFSVSIYLIPFIISINTVFYNIKLRTATILMVSLFFLHFLIGQGLNGLIWTIITYILKGIMYILINIVNFMFNRNLIFNFGFDINSARNSASVWNSAMGNEIFCGEKAPLYLDIITNGCLLQINDFDHISVQYKIIKSIPILQWINWVEIKYKENRNNKYIDLIAEVISCLIRDATYLNSRTFRNLIIGVFSPLILVSILSLLS
ncbi:putative glycosylphosphatidylinositol anchor attachment protein 1 [Cryptosporidium felis]|nr:putative glycosylphosphatidylinositol anchor attachment protein 1 [Cryptosporidium felis]